MGCNAGALAEDFEDWFAFGLRMFGSGIWDLGFGNRGGEGARRDSSEEVRWDGSQSGMNLG